MDESSSPAGDQRERLGIERLTTARLDDLVVEDSIRDPSLCPDRLAELMSQPTAWEPIVVKRDDLRVVDGRHRVWAARALGFETIAVTWFDGSIGDAFVEFLRLNGSHVPGLATAERHLAVQRVLELHPNWADRRIGELCGISPKTVAQVRTRFGAGAQDEGSTSAFRVGRDGRSRPVDSATQRQKILEVLIDDPEASLRSVAARVGVSPETVRRVRLTIGEPRREGCVGPPTADLFGVLFVRRSDPSWGPEAAVQSVDESARTAEFLERTDVVESEIPVYAGAVPLSRVYEVADEARRRAAIWSRLAERVEGRVRRGHR